MDKDVSGTFSALLQEDRRFPPPPQFAEQANVRDAGVYEEARRDPEGYWAEQAKQVGWFTTYQRVLGWKFPWC